MAYSCLVQSRCGVLVSGYHLAARLTSCEVRREIETLNQQTSSVVIVVGWIDPFWSTQPMSLIVQFDRAEWVWREASFLEPLVQGATAHGVVLGDPVARPLSR